MSRRRHAEVPAEVIKDHLRHHAENLEHRAEALGCHASETAAKAAAHAKEWSTPHVDAAIDWIAPRAAKAWDRGVTVAAPHVVNVAHAVKPKVDAAHEKIVEEILPSIIELATTAAEGVGVASEEASARTRGAAQVLTGEAVAVTVGKKKKHRVGKVFLWLGIGTAIAAAGLVAWQRTRPIEDPWADDLWDDEDPTEAVVEKATRTAEAVSKGTASVAETAKKAGSAAKKAVDDAGDAAKS